MKFITLFTNYENGNCRRKTANQVQTDKTELAEQTLKLISVTFQSIVWSTECTKKVLGNGI